MRIHIFLASLLLCVSAFSSTAATKSAATSLAPDFAYPQTVEKNALRDLDNALAKNDWKNAAVASVKSITASNLISRENVVSGLARLDSICKLAPAEWKPVFQLMQADIYESIYSSQKWQMDSRQLPLDSFPSNPYDWSRELFAIKILDLCNPIVDKAPDMSAPIASWTPLLSDTSYASGMGMTVGEFLYLRSFDLLNAFADPAADVIPFFATSPDPVTPAQKCAALRDKAVDCLIQLSDHDKNQSPILAKSLVLKSRTLPVYQQSTALKNAYQALKGSVGEQEILYEMANSQYFSRENTEDEPFGKTEFIKTLKESVARYPKGVYANALRNQIESYTQPSVELRNSNQILSSSPVKVSVTLRNCKETFLLVYDYSPFIDAKENPKTSEITSGCRLVKSMRVSGGCAECDTVVETDLGKFSPGSYVVIPSSASTAKGIYVPLSKNRWSPTFSVSDLSYYILRGQNQSTRVFIVDGKNGRPIEGAKVSVFEEKYWNSPKKLLSTMTTNKDGFVDVPYKSFEFRADYKGSSCSSDFAIYTYTYRPDMKERVNVSFFTDRSIYHPGDSIEAAVVAYASKGYDLSLCSDMPVSVRLMNASGKEAARTEIRLDSDGRGRVAFRLPDSGMLGHWSLSATTGEDRLNGTGYFQVADYVAPSFFITADKESEEVDLGTTARISGQVLTYSGMPLPASEVKYSVSYMPVGRWRSFGGATYDSSVTTDGEGKYIIDLPTSNLKGTVFDKGIFYVNISATSPAGETQSGPNTSFAIGQNYSIYPLDSHADYDITDGLPTLTVKVKNILGQDVEKEVRYSINDSSGNQIANGSFTSPLLKLPGLNWESEVYDIFFTLADDKSVDADMKVTLWRSSDQAAPKGTQLWVPQTKVVAAKGADSVLVKVGQGNPDRWIPAVLSGPDSIVSVIWLHVERDNLSVDLPVPPSGSHYELNLNSLTDLVSDSKTVNIYPADFEDRLKVTTVSFRDRLTAGDKERWSFRFSNGELPASFVPVMAVMTDKSLNAIADFTWRFNPHGYSTPRYYAMGNQFVGDSYSGNYYLANRKSFNFRKPIYPSIDTYYMSWGLGVNVANVVNEMKFSRGALQEKMVTGMSITPTSANLAMKAEAPMMAEMAMDVEEQADHEAEIFASVEDSADESGKGASPADSSELRDAEHPVAFFMPMLSTNEDGIVYLDFDVPNFNTTWALQVLGYDKKLQTAKIALEAVAAKLVMVRLTAPRFLRTGDEATLTATLFNNSGEDIPVSGTIEIVDPLTGNLIASTDYAAAEIRSSGNRIVSMSWTVPSGISQVALRAYAEGASHRDGEQVIVPILPASSPVVESTPFWLAPGQSIFETKLPKFKSTDRITLQYCDNPVWYCVSALPDITIPESVSILSKMRALYGNMVAHHLISSNPTLWNGLEFMLSDQNSDFAALKSNLQKDGNLKLADLDNTPWINSAELETLRMSRLSTLLSDSTAKSAINSLLDEIRQRQTPEGGWSWCPDMPASEWITREVVRMFALISQAGALDHNAEDEDMLKKAIAFIDSSEVESYRKYHKNGDSLAYLLDWLYIRSFFPSTMLSSGKDSKAFGEIASKAIADIDASWKNLSIDSKAKAAILLWRSEKKKTASLILESIRQYTSESPAKGIWFDNLDSSQYGLGTIQTTARVLEAFAEIQPENPIIDGIRQYLVLCRQTQDWGQNTYTADVVNAILTSGSDWTVSSGQPFLRLGGKKIEVPQYAAMTGAFTISLDPKKASGSTLKIERNATSQAWGGVISQFEAPLDDIKSADVPGLSISKSIVAIVPDESGTMTPKKDINLSKGMKVRVTLNINADRDMDFVMVRDQRSACLEPASQISAYTSSDGVWFYREVRNEVTNLFFSRLPKGVHVISYDCWVTLPGEYSCGIATVQSQYAPTEVAHSSAVMLTVE